MKKGNMLIAQSGGPSMVINQSLIGAVLTAREHPRVGNVMGALHGIQGILQENFINLRQESKKRLEAVANTPGSALGSVRHKPDDDECQAIFTILRKLDTRYFFYIGGNDSAETVQIINAAARRDNHDLHCFHIPKTIDNDLRENDHTPGYGSAALFVASAIKGDDLDNRALGGVKIDIIMGRHAGFLTAAAALARESPDDGPHLIYLPEKPFEMQNFVADVQKTMQRYGRCVVAVSEGIVDQSGTPILARYSDETDSHGNLQLSGTGALGDLLATTLKEQAQIKRVRADTFGYLQRSFPGVISQVDAAEARQVGIEAVTAAVEHNLIAGSIAIKRKPTKKYGITYEVVPLNRVARETRSMPQAFINRAGNDVTQAFIDYVRPLVGPLPPCARFKQLEG